MGRAYLIRYGLTRAVGRFEAEQETFEKSQTVVIRTHRGTELGEVLAEAFPDPGSDASFAPILRLASPDDLARAASGERNRNDHFEVCRAVFEGGSWPLELIDAEPLLDEKRTILHYLGPHRLDASGLIAAFRDRCGLDVVLEPAGRDIPDPEPEPEPEPRSEEKSGGCGSCGSSGGGCGSGGCESATGGCAVKALVARRRVAQDD